MISPKSVISEPATLSKSGGNASNNTLFKFPNSYSAKELKASKVSPLAQTFSDYHLAYRARYSLMVKIANF